MQKPSVPDLVSPYKVSNNIHGPSLGGLHTDKIRVSSKAAREVECRGAAESVAAAQGAEPGVGGTSVRHLLHDYGHAAQRVRNWPAAPVRVEPARGVIKLLFSFPMASMYLPRP